MAKVYKTGIIITGDGKGGIKAIQATSESLKVFDEKNKKARSSVKQMSASVAESSKAMAGYATKITGVGLAFAGFVAYRANVIKQEEMYARAIGVSTNAMQRLSYAFQDTGISQEKLGDILKDTSEKIGDFITTGGGAAADTLERLGLEAKNLANLSPDQQLLKIAESLNKVETRSEKIFLLENLASDASLLLPILEQGADKLKELTDEAEHFGVALSDIDNTRIAEASSEMAKAMSVMSGASNLITAEFAPALGDLAEKFTDNIVSAEQFTANVKTMEFYATTAVNTIRMEVNDLIDSFTALGLKAILTYEILNTEVSLNTFDDIRDKIAAYNAAIDKLYLDNKAFDDSLKQSALLSRYAGVKSELIDLGQEFKIQEENAKKLNKQTSQVFEPKNLKQIDADKKQQLKNQLATEKRWLESVKEYHEEYRAELEADAKAIEKAQKATEKWDKEQGKVGDKHNDEISNLVLDIDNMGDAWTRTGDKASQAITSMLKMSMDYANQTSQLSDNQQKIDNLRFENLDKLSLKQININKFKENETKLSELQAKIDKEKADKNIAYYAGLAGAISNAYETGSKEALAFQTIQQGLALYDGIRAVVSAWSAPYPLNLVQVPLTIANVGALLSQMGTSFSGGSAPSAVAKQAETGSGVLGGGVSNSIENSMDYMDSIQADQYAELRGIHAQTKLLNGSIDNAVATLFRTDEFHNMGTGYSATVENGIMNTIGESVFNTMTLGVFQGLGSSVGDITNSIMGGRNKANQSDYGVSATGTMGQTGLSGYSDVSYKKDGGWFGKDKKWTETSYSELQAKSENNLNLIFDSMSNQAIEYGKALDMNVSSQVANTAIVIGKISGTGSAEDVQKRYTEAFNKQSDHLINTVFGNVIEEYRKMGEASAETLNRLIINKVAVEDILAMTNQAVVSDVIAFSDSLVTLAGGLSELKQSADSYYDNFFSDAEKEARNKKLLTEVLGEQNIALALNRKSYRLTLEAIDQSTEAGKKQYITMLQASEMADKYFTSIEKAQQSLLSEQLRGINNAINSLKGLNQLLTSTLDKLIGSVTTDSATYMQAQSTVFDALNEARNGNLPELDSIRQALSVISSNDINNYATAEAFNFEQKTMANAVSELMTLTGSQISYEDKSLALLEAIKNGVTLENSSLIRAISGGFSVLDLNQDNQISLSEFQNTFKDFATESEMQAMFNGLDLDKSGSISKVESAISTMNTSFNNIDFNQNSEIDYEEFSRTFEHLASKTEMQAMFNGLDLDKNGSISKLESAMLAMNTSFNNIDFNQNNEIDYEEFDGAFSHLASTSQMRAMFSSLDLNRDGTLTVAELNKHTSLLTNIDTTSTAIANATNAELKKVIASNGGNTSGVVSGSGSLDSRTLAQLMRTALAIKSSEHVWSQSGMAQSYRDLFTGDRLYETDKETLKRDYINWIEVYGLDGSHATGLAKVPFDNYRANLHKDEAVIDARTMQGMRKYGIHQSNQSNNSQLVKEIRALKVELEQIKSTNNAIAFSNHELASQARRNDNIPQRVEVVS